MLVSSLKTDITTYKVVLSSNEANINMPPIFSWLFEFQGSWKASWCYHAIIGFRDMKIETELVLWCLWQSQRLHGCQKKLLKRFFWVGLRRNALYKHERSFLWKFFGHSRKMSTITEPIGPLKLGISSDNSGRKTIKSTLLFATKLNTTSAIGCEGCP